MIRFTNTALGQGRPAELAAQAERLPFVSVIVPVYNDAVGLLTCLHALTQQTYPTSRHEIIVVDNGSTDGSAEVAARFAGVRVASETTVGSYSARNRGIADAHGDILAFTDADCIPASDWIEQGVAHLGRADRCGLVAGRIHMYPRETDRPTTIELYEALFDFDQQRFVERGRFGATANLFTYAAVMREIGSFDPALRSGGDRDWGSRVAAGGYAQLYASTATVRHPARRSLRVLLAKRFRVAGGHRDIARKRGRRARGFVGAVAQQVVRRPFNAALTVCSRRVRAPLGQKLRLVGLVVLLGWAETVERLRLELGGDSRR